MPNGIRLGVAADTREFDRGIKQGIVDPLEDAQDALRDLAKDGDRAGSDLERTFRDQQDATKKFERNIKDVGDTIRSTSRKAGRDLDDGIGDGLDKAGDGLTDFKDEARDTAREGAASFTGEWDDVGDVVQETLANAFAGFGPIGAAAGIAAAVGFGTLYAKIQEDAEKSEERIDSMFQSFLESGQSYASQEMINDRIKEIAGDTDEYNKALETSSALGVDVSQVLRAMAGDTAAYQNVVNDAQDSLKDMQEEQQANIDSGKGLDSVLQGQIDALDKSIQGWQKQSTEVDQARQKYDAVTKALSNTKGQTDQVVRGLDGVRRAIQQIPSGKVFKLTADTSTFVSDVQYAVNRAGQAVKGGINVKVRATNSTGRVVY